MRLVRDGTLSSEVLVQVLVDVEDRLVAEARQAGKHAVAIAIRMVRERRRLSGTEIFRAAGIE
jgi:hypothetical protein